MRKIEFINKEDSSYNITLNSDDNPLVVPSVRKGDYVIRVTSDIHLQTSEELVIADNITINIRLIKGNEENVHPEIEITDIGRDSETGYGTLDITIVEQGEIKPTITWEPVTTKQTIDYVVLPDIETAELPKGERKIQTEGASGERTIVTEYEYRDGVPTGNSRLVSDTITKPAVDEQWLIGTKEESVTPSTSVLTDANVSVGGSTNTFVDGNRTANDKVPLDKPFELRQWAKPVGALNIKAGDMAEDKQYTLSFKMKNIGKAVEKAHFVIGTTFFGGKHFFDGQQVTINPSAGQYDFTQHFKNGGELINYKYQFTSDKYDATDYFQVAFDNATSDTIVQISDVKLVEGVI